MIEEAHAEGQPQPIVHAMDTNDTALMDAQEVLAMDVYQKGGLALFQQAVAQLASIREMLEAKLQQRGGQRCPPPNHEQPEPQEPAHGCLAR